MKLLNAVRCSFSGGLKQSLTMNVEAATVPYMATWLRNRPVPGFNFLFVQILFEKFALSAIVGYQ